MELKNPATSASAHSTYHEWARIVRKQRPPASLEEHLQNCRMFFDHYASLVERWRRRNRGYHAALESIARHYVPAGARVLEVGSGAGDLLAATYPSVGVGLDISEAMVRLASGKYPHLRFLQMPAESLDLGGEKFDYIILSDLVGLLYDIRLVLDRVRVACHRHTRIIINWYSRAWQPVLALAERLGLKYPQPLLNWTTPEDICNLLHLSGFEVVRLRRHILAPKRVPLLTAAANRVLAHLPLLSAFCLSNWIVARPLDLDDRRSEFSVSVICPCRNEAGNIGEIAARLPALGAHTELIFVEGHSRDETLEQCHLAARRHSEKDIKVLVQEGRGKGDAGRLGFSKATGDILMILDADLSLAPEDLPQFYEALASGKADLANGSRLVYAMDPKAMRFLNLLANRLFAVLFSRLTGQHVKDSLCGTKVLWREDYERLARDRAYFGELDPYGDFDLLFGAAKLNMKIVDVPVRYRQRVYGATNLSRFAGGYVLLKVCLVAAVKLFFVS